MFNNITKDMISELDSVNLKRFNYIKGYIERGELTPPLVIRRFSDLAFSLAQKNLRSGTDIAIADPLLNIFNQYLDSPLVSIEAKEKMAPLIGETKLDFRYASGKHNISSLRLAPYLIARKAHQ